MYVFYFYMNIPEAICDPLSCTINKNNNGEPKIRI